MRHGTAYRFPMFQVLGMPDEEARRIIKRRMRHVVILPVAQDGGIGIVSGKDDFRKVFSQTAQLSKENKTRETYFFINSSLIILFHYIFLSVHDVDALMQTAQSLGLPYLFANHPAGQVIYIHFFHQVIVIHGGSRDIVAFVRTYVIKAEIIGKPILSVPGNDAASPLIPMTRLPFST